MMRPVTLILSSWAVLSSCMVAHSADQSGFVGINCKMVPLKSIELSNQSAKSLYRAPPDDDLPRKWAPTSISPQVYRLNCSGKNDDGPPVIPIFKSTYKIQKSKK